MNADQMALVLPPAVRRTDLPTSLAAADAIGRRVTELHERVLAAFHELGPMTDEQLERLPRFDEFGPSTIRKRRSELYQMGRLMQAGTAANSRGRAMVIWTVMP